MALTKEEDIKKEWIIQEMKQQELGSYSEEQVRQKTINTRDDILTFLRKGAVDYLAALTSSFIFIVLSKYLGVN